MQIFITNIQFKTTKIKLGLITLSPLKYDQLLTHPLKYQTQQIPLYIILPIKHQLLSWSNTRDVQRSMEYTKNAFFFVRMHGMFK